MTFLLRFLAFILKCFPERFLHQRQNVAVNGRDFDLPVKLPSL